MKRFEFGLDSVLRLREIRLDAERRKLGQVTAEQDRLRRELVGLSQERVNAGDFLHRIPGGAGALELRAFSGFLLGCRARAALVRDRIEALERAILNQRQRVIAAEREVRLLEKLKDKKLQEWRRACDQELETVAQETWLAARFREKSEEGVKKIAVQAEKSGGEAFPPVLAE
jgi:flagellar export protein FliJ